MRKVDQEYAIAITIIVVLVCNPSYIILSHISCFPQVCISPLMMVLVRNAVRAVQVRI